MPEIKECPFTCPHQGKGKNSDLDSGGKLIKEGFVQIGEDGQWCDWRIPFFLSLVPRDEYGKPIAQDISCLGPLHSDCPAPEDAKFLPT